MDEKAGSEWMRAKGESKRKVKGRLGEGKSVREVK